MGYLRKLVLVNSAGYPLADVRLDGHCDFAGGQGVGKTTLMNAILFPFVVEDQFLDIDSREKERFSLYYFKYANSFVIYEIVNNKDVPYCVLINRTGTALNFHFISAPFNIEWLYNGDEQVKGWTEVKQNLSRLGIVNSTEDRMWKFNNILLGKGDSYDERFSIVRTPKDRDAVRPLISAIFKNRPFNQDTLKESLVAAVLSSNQVENEGIDLLSHRKNLEDFTKRYSDIRKMTMRDKNGRTVIDPIAESIFSLVEQYYSNDEQRRNIPGLLLYAVSAASESSKRLDKIIETLTAKEASYNAKWQEEQARYDDNITDIKADKKVVDEKIKEIAEREKKYKDVNIEELVIWIKDKKLHESELASLKKRYGDLTADSRDIEDAKKKALEGNKQFYQNKENNERRASLTRQKALNDSKKTVTEEYVATRIEIEAQYHELLGSEWRETESHLINTLIVLTSKLSTAETLDEVRTALAEVDSKALEPALSTILLNRNGSDETVEQIRLKVEEAKVNLTKGLDQKMLLEKEKAERLTAINAEEARKLADIDKQLKDEDTALINTLKGIVAEHNSKASEISSEYNAKLSGGDPQVRAIIQDLDSQIESENYILEMIDKFPAAAEDKAEIDKKSGLLARKNTLDQEYISLLDNKNAAKKAYDEVSEETKAALEQAKTERRAFSEDISANERFLSNRSDMRAAYESASPIESGLHAKDIIENYNDIIQKIDRLKDDLPEAVRRLYAPDMLSRVDTFQLGISYNDSLSSFDEYLAVAEKLRVRLENGTEDLGMDKYIKLNTDVWLNEIRDISSIMSPVEDMLMQIQKLCRKATSFVKEHNGTDCIDSFSMNVNEKDTTDLVRLLRETARFYQEKGFVLGFDNLFSSEEEPANKEAIRLLEKLSTEMEESGADKISLSSMFDIRMDITEKGNSIKNALSFNNFGSKGTAAVLKAMLNMTLLHLFLEKHQAPNTRLICAIDEMNTIEAKNLDALTVFASAAGLFIIGSGQHHTKSALDYSYNVFDDSASRYASGVINKYVSMDAMEEKELR